MKRAHANTQAAAARSAQAYAPLYPQLEASAGYQRTTANFVPRPGQLPGGLQSAEDPDFDFFDYFTFGISARQLVYDFGLSYGRADAARAEAGAEQADERATVADVEANVRLTFFTAWAAKALLHVAREALANYEQHVQQIDAFVRAGTRADIDLAQARTDRANARVDLIVAENTYIASKARLNRAIGRVGSTDFDVEEQGLPAVDGEDGTLESLLQRAVAHRPELVALERRVARAGLHPQRAARRPLPEPQPLRRSDRSGRGAERHALERERRRAARLAALLGRRGVGAGRRGERELAALRAELEGLRQQLRLEVEEARLALRAAKGVTEATEEAITSAREQLRLAEGRYAAGVGSGLELADAQLAMQDAAAQRVQAEYRLASARAQLLRALGQ